MKLGKITSAILVLCLGINFSYAQQKVGGIVQFDRTVHDFGDIMTTDGPVSCTFTLTNVSTKPVLILSVISSCGCTDVEWTREEIQPGKTGTVSATYKNEDGETMFDKSITCYISDLKQPVILKLRGAAHHVQAPLKDLYSIHFGNFALKETEIQGGNLQQGAQKSGQFLAANIGKVPIKVEFRNVSDGLAISISPNPVSAGTTATVSYTISADRSKWGKNFYYATPFIDGKEQKAVIASTAKTEKRDGAEALQTDANERLGAGKSEIGIWAFTKENFDSWTKEQKNAGANPYFEHTNYSIDKVKAGKKLTVSFKCKNLGKQDLKIYSINSDSKKVSSTIPADIKPGKEGVVTAELDTTGLPKGEVLILLTLTTNSPLRPLVNLFITGVIE